MGLQHPGRIILFGQIIFGMAFLCLSFGSARACIVRMDPQTRSPEGYGKIFAGEVLSVAIAEKRPGALPFGYSPIHSLLIRVIDVFKGQVEAEVRLDHLTGCSMPVPREGSFGVFFVSPNGRVDPMYFPASGEAAAVLARMREPR